MGEAASLGRTRRGCLRHVISLFTFHCLKEYEIVTSSFFPDYHKREDSPFFFSVLPARETSFDLRAEVHSEIQELRLTAQPISQKYVKLLLNSMPIPQFSKRPFTCF